MEYRKATDEKVKQAGAKAYDKYGQVFERLADEERKEMTQNMSAFGQVGKTVDPYEDFLNPQEALSNYVPKYNEMTDARLVEYADGLRKAIERGGWNHEMLESRLDEAKDAILHRINPAKYPGFYIWSEGFETQGKILPAYILGWCTGETFNEACCNYADRDAFFAQNFDLVNIRYYGRKLYDNEADARKAFG